MAPTAASSQDPTTLDNGGGPTFELMFAPLLIGVILNAMLFGVFIVLVHSYFRLYKTDYAWIRYLIFYLIVLETVNTVCDIGLIYQPLITLRNSANVLIKSPTLLAADPIVTSLISTPTQLFMAWRIRLVTKSTWLAGVVVLLAFTSLVGGVVSSVLVALHPEFENFRSLDAPLALWLTSTAFADLFITAFLVNFLWVNKTGFQTQTDSLTDRIIFFTVQTGTLTSFAAIADISLFLIVPHTTLMFIWDFSLSKLYSICLIATLNARNEWNRLLTESPADNVNLLSPKRKNSKDKEEGPNIIKIRRATDIRGLQLYIPSQFEIAAHTSASPRKRTPRDSWIPRPLLTASPTSGPVPTSSTVLLPPLSAPGTQTQTSDEENKGHGRGRSHGRGREHRHGHGKGHARDLSAVEEESARRTAEWAMQAQGRR